MRVPSVPLFNIDPYFSVWSASDKLYDKYTEHWTASPNSIEAVVIVDGDYSVEGYLHGVISLVLGAKLAERQLHRLPVVEVRILLTGIHI